MSKRSKTPRVEVDTGPPARLAQPFAALAGLREQLFGAAEGDAGSAPAAEEAARPRAEAPARPATPQQRPPARHQTAAAAHGSGPARAGVRYERKGRGGKEVTLVEKLGLAADELESWCRELKRALGCGGHVEGGAIALAGDQRGRLSALLEGRGVRRVSVS